MRLGVTPAHQSGGFLDFLDDREDFAGRLQVTLKDLGRGIDHALRV